MSAKSPFVGFLIQIKDNARQSIWILLIDLDLSVDKIRSAIY